MCGSRKLVNREPGTGKDEWCRKLVNREPGTGKDEYEWGLVHGWKEERGRATILHNGCCHTASV
jgi:hypothetical protein